jgi:carbamoyltransferase
MRILGITDGQTSGAAIIEDGRILAAINEERISRIKLARGFPRESIREVLALSSTSPSDISEVAVAQVNMELTEKVLDWPGWFEARDADANLHSRFFQVASRFGGFAPKVPGLKRAYYALRTPAFRHRRARIEEILKEEFSIHAPLRFIHHHHAHATSAYYTSGFDDALVLTMDGGGDGHCSHVYEVRGGSFHKLVTADSYDSLGNYYAYVTALCGFKAKRHEGKITGLAAQGKPAYRAIFDAMIVCENGQLQNRGRVLFKQAMDRLRAGLPNDWNKEDLAATIQTVSEEVTCAYVRHWVQKTGLKKVALAGGLFANVRINEEVLRIPEVEEVFIHPGMSDEGLAVGAALAVDGKRARAEGKLEPRRLETCYLGNAYGEREIADAVERLGLEKRHLPGTIEAEIARLLARGKVVARFDGKMEYGPRALGNRTIMYQPGDPSVNDWLNELLKRTEFMPFAPSVLAERTHELFQNAAGGEDAARFMTITFHCTEWMAERCSGTVHVDNTARPQLVRQQDNPSFHRVISEYEKLTGVPVVINTSFNVHEEPIVRSPDDAIRAFLDSKLDYIALGDFLVTGPESSEPTRKKWEGKSKWGRVARPVAVR